MLLTCFSQALVVNRSPKSNWYSSSARLHTGDSLTHVPLCSFVCVCVCVCVQILFLVQDGNLRALVTGRSLFWLPLSGTTFLLTSHIAVRSHSSKRLLEHFSLLLPALNYSNPLLSPFLTRRMFVRPNILRTLRRTMIRFLN